MAFSCKGRLCPSCWARRAADTAADLVDRVLPEARYRQWVLTFPWQMCFLLATDRAFQGLVLRTFLRTVGAWMRLRARRLGLRGGQVGAVTFVQRFGGILNLNPHFHTLMPDGVFLEDADAPGGPLAFATLPPPTDAEIAALGLRLAGRIGELARQRFRRTQDDPPWQDPDELPLRITVAEAVRPPGPRPPRALPWDAASPPDDQGSGKTPAKALCTRVQGFSLHAARTCVFRRSRSPIPEEADHGFRGKPITDSEGCRSPFRSEATTHPVDATPGSRCQRSTSDVILGGALGSGAAA